MKGDNFIVRVNVQQFGKVNPKVMYLMRNTMFGPVYTRFRDLAKTFDFEEEARFQIRVLPEDRSKTYQVVKI